MPLELICTDRVLLRPVLRGDIDALHTLWTAPEVRRYLWDDIVITHETVRQAVESHFITADRLSLGYWVIHVPPPVSIAAAPVAGFCGFRLIDEGPEVELLYGLRGEHWGKGLAMEACVAALAYFWRWTRYRQVYARTDPPNYRSVQVMRRLGMVHASTTPSMITYVLCRPGGSSAGNAFAPRSEPSQ